jgi:RNA polymerase sigma-70 factor (ECF subfamily)
VVEAAGVLLLSQAAPVAMDGPVLSPASSLAIRARDGDDAAFDQLMASTQDRILSLAWRLLGNAEDARDAAQETYLRVYRHLGRYRPDHDFEAWLYRIAVNVCRDVHRRRGSGAVRSFEGETAAGRIAEPRSEADTEGRACQEERRRLVLQALAALPPRQRAALVLHDLEGKTSQQVARILGSRPGTVRSQLASARARLKRAFALLAHRRDGRIR